MKARVLRALLMASACGLSALAAVEAGKLPPAATVKVGFEKDIAPLFENSCVSCHGPNRPPEFGTGAGGFYRVVVGP